MTLNHDPKSNPEKTNGGETFFVRFLKGVAQLELLVKGTFRYILIVVGILLAILLLAWIL